MKNLLVILLVTITLNGFAQNPLNGQFFNFYNKEIQINPGSLPFYYGVDDNDIPQYAYFYPSLIKQYTDMHNLTLYGIDLSFGRIPGAKLEINANPGGIFQIPALIVYGGNIGLDAAGSLYGIKTQGSVGIDITGDSKGVAIHCLNDNSFGIYQSAVNLSKNYFQNRIGIGTETPVAMLDIRDAGEGDYGIYQGGVSLTKNYFQSKTGIGTENPGAMLDVHNSGDIDFAIYQSGGTLTKNYFQNKTGIGTETPAALLDIHGNMNCTGPAGIGTQLELYNGETTNPFNIRSDNTSIKFQFIQGAIPDGGPGNSPSNEWTTLMTMSVDTGLQKVDINGTTNTNVLNVATNTNTHSLNVTEATNTGSLNVAHSTVTSTFKMTTDPGLNKAMISDVLGNGQWVDVTSWLDKYWQYNDSLDVYSKGQKVGIGILPADYAHFRNHKFTVLSADNTTGIYAENSSHGRNRHGIVSYLLDPSGGNTEGGPGNDGAVADTQPTIDPNSYPVSDGFYANVSNQSGSSDAGCLAGFNTEIKDNGACSGGTFGFRSLIDGSYSSNSKYGIYSEIRNGQANSRWAGYFKGGDLELNGGSFIIGDSKDKRFMIQSQNEANNRHSLYIFPGSGNNWDRSSGIAISDSGNLFVSRNIYNDGILYARQIEVNLDQYPLPDYVFSPDYKLKSLKEVEDYIKVNNHLPEIPSSSEIKSKGANLGELNVALLKKVEELTLYVIDLKKEIEEIKKK